MRIESTAADRGFGLQTGCAVMLFSYGDADKREVLSGSRSGEEVALAEELSFFDSSIRRTRAVEECPAPPPARSSPTANGAAVGISDIRSRDHEAFLPLGMSLRR